MSSLTPVPPPIATTPSRQAFHSLWLGWACVGLGWIGFGYIALRAKQPKWGLAAAGYLAFFLAWIVTKMAMGDALGDLVGGLYIIAGLPILIHALLVRKEYVLRMTALEQTQGLPEEQLQRRIAAEYALPAGRKRLKSAGRFGESSARDAAGLRTAPAELAPFQRMLVMHLIAAGQPLDATTESADLADCMAELERDGLVEIDVARAAYRLTLQGAQQHAEWLAEGEALVKIYDVFADLDLDTGAFLGGLGQDYRVPFYELDKLNPFKARFLVGLSDGEWDEAPEWWRTTGHPRWFASIFRPVEAAPTPDELGHDRLVKLRGQAHKYLAKAASR